MSSLGAENFAAGPSRATAHPWLNVYPKEVNWSTTFHPSLLGDLLDSAVRAYGDRPCTYFLGKRVTYAEIGALSDRAAKGLQALGVCEGVKVGLMLPNSPTYVIFYFAVLKAGGTVVNFNPLYSVEELDFQARDSGTDIMVTFDLAALFEKVEAVLAGGGLRQAVVAKFADLLPPVKSVGFRVFNSPQLAKLKESSQRSKLLLEEDVLANDGLYRRPSTGTDAVAVLQYTGGTTGTPKGAMLSHANLSINVEQLKAWRRQLPDLGQSIFALIPFFHVFAMTTILNFGISQGMELILLPRFDLVQALKLIHRLRPSMMPGVPTLFNAMLRYPGVRKFDLSSLAYCLSGGAPLPIEVKRGFEALCHCHLVEGYGLSETSPVVSCNPLDREPREGSIGLPLPATEISIRSLENPVQEMAIGERGEICVAGPQVMHGYWNKPEETKESFVGRFFRTGDVGTMDEDGYVYIVDRIKDMINASGFKVYPRRIEDALYRHPAIAEAVVIGIPDAYRGEAPKAFVKLKADAEATAAELLDFLRQRLAKIELPAEIEFRDELPKTMVGKHSKKHLRDEQTKDG